MTIQTAFKPLKAELSAEVKAAVPGDSEVLLQSITEHYLKSDFNGFPLKLKKLVADRRALVKDLIRGGQIDLNFGELHPNPHIKAVPLGTIDGQLLKLDSGRYDFACAYPSPAHLLNVVDGSHYAEQPFNLRLVLGAPQLEFHAFDLTILEHYRNDPRYYYYCNDISGRIGVSGQHSGGTTLRKPDQVLLENFGFCFDEKLNRAVAAFLRYLSRLSPEHQQIWEARRLDGHFNLHPDFWAITCGHFVQGMPVFSAFLWEQKTINEMCSRMGKPPLFKNDYVDENRPRDFAFLVRPTRREYNQFVHTLDRIISENINRDFFRGDLSFEEEIIRTDKRIEVRPKGTISLLREWLELYFRTSDCQPLKDMIKTFRDVRQLRQEPAHTLKGDSFDQAFIHEQRDLMGRAYNAMNILRQIFARHPANKAFQLSPRLDDFEIRMY